MTNETKAHVAHIGLCMSDLSVHIFAFVTENATDAVLEHEVASIRADVIALLHHVTAVAKARGYEDSA